MKLQSCETIILQGRTEVEGDLLRSLLESEGVNTFHEPSAASAILGRTTGFRFAVRRQDQNRAAEVLEERGLSIQDFIAVKSAYNLDVPFHLKIDAEHPSPSWRGLAAGIAFLVLMIFFLTRAC